MKVIYWSSANDDLTRQFRYYLVTQDAPAVALRFRSAVRHAVASLLLHPEMAPLYPVRNRRLQNLRSWPVGGFEAMRIYYVADANTLQVVRILHSKWNVRALLERES